MAKVPKTNKESKAKAMDKSNLEDELDRFNYETLDIIAEFDFK